MGHEPREALSMPCASHVSKEVCLTANIASLVPGTLAERSEAVVAVALQGSTAQERARLSGELAACQMARCLGHRTAYALSSLLRTAANGRSRTITDSPMPSSRVQNTPIPLSFDGCV